MMDLSIPRVVHRAFFTLSEVIVLCVITKRIPSRVRNLVRVVMCIVGSSTRLEMVFKNHSYSSGSFPKSMASSM